MNFFTGDSLWLAGLLWALAVAATIADWLQTLTIAKHPDLFTEFNPILGKHPSVARVNIYFASFIILFSALFVLMLAEKMLFMPMWMVGVIFGMECCVVWMNHRNKIWFDDL